MGNAISFRLNPKNENDRKILEWLDMKSSLTGYKNQTELIKNAILAAIESERKGERERSIESWISEAILLSRKEYSMQLGKIGSNLNQIEKYLNSGGVFLKVYLEVDEAIREMLDLKFKILPALEDVACGKKHRRKTKAEDRDWRS